MENGKMKNLSRPFRSYESILAILRRFGGYESILADLGVLAVINGK
jgi:hypothetical protein